MSRRLPDLTGQRFGKLQVISREDDPQHRATRYRCKCDCGKILVVRGREMIRADKPQKSCGCGRRKADPRRMNKRCSRCCKTKPIEDFPYNRAKLDGHIAYCRTCNRERNHKRVLSIREKEHRRQHTKQRRVHDPSFRLAGNLRQRMYNTIKGAKSATTVVLIGCSVDYLREHLERQFRLGMSWENYGKDGWQIDHIRPCASFDLTDPVQQRQCFHWSNLQPLWAHENKAKGGRYEQ